MEDVAFSLEGKTDSEPSRISSVSLSPLWSVREGERGSKSVIKRGGSERRFECIFEA